MKDLRFRAAGILGHGLLGGLFTTTRLTRVDDEHYKAYRRRGENVIFVFWHGQMLPLIHYHQGEGIVVLVSEHADGEYITRVIERHGFGTARGSSSRGGSRGLRELIRAAREGHDLGLSPDGPRGPAEVFKPGALVAAQLTGLPIIPMSVGVSGAWHLDSWDRFLVPKPLSRVRIVYGEPVLVPRAADDAVIEGLASELERRLGVLRERAEAPFPEGR